MPAPDVDRAQAIALAVSKNPYFQIVTNKGLTEIVIMSTESYDAVVAANISVHKGEPVD
jgi:hypothetical protein